MSTSFTTVLEHEFTSEVLSLYDGDCCIQRFPSGILKIDIIDSFDLACISDYAMLKYDHHQYCYESGSLVDIFIYRCVHR